ncbi:MAG: hypothetical protein AUK55_02840, partial [Syntrophobacteraceae bacterium CG2_30_61_12]
MKEQSLNFFESVLTPPKQEILTWRKKFGRRFFHPFSIDSFLRMLVDNQFDVEPRYYGKLIAFALSTAVNTVPTVIERIRYSARIEATRLVESPVFILGHWRNGTTFLHNLMSQDISFTCPRLYQVLFAGYFLLPRIKRLVARLDQAMPARVRPMDNVKMGMYEAWEDEFILIGLSGISPYSRIWFPKRQGPSNNYLYPGFKSEAEARYWKKTFLTLLKRLTLLEAKTILLKSPTHTARINTLLEMFPNSKFIHIARHPYDVFASNLKLWRDSFSLGFLQSVTEFEMVEMIFSTYEQMYQIYAAQKSNIPPHQLVEITFESLEQDPLGVLQQVYQGLSLPGFDAFARRVSDYL